jgi:16S rRNA (guanine527-N7)-methyltransferase
MRNALLPDSSEDSGETSNFEDELESVLPPDLPHRANVVKQSAAHLRLIEETNRQFNLTRITGVREAAIKHVLDSVIPWRLFADAKHVLDAGTGAGFPGIPLALVLPDTRFTLVESTQKKARFVEAAAAALKLSNVKVRADRAEDLAVGSGIITARAVAPVSRALGLFGPALKSGATLLLYKGPDVEQEIAEATPDAAKQRLRMRVVLRYELPDSLGIRTIVEIAS